MRTSNPVLSEGTFSRYAYSAQTMTISGTVAKAFVLLLLALSTAMYAFKSGSAALVTGGVIFGLISAIATMVRPTWGVITAPLYAIFEGFVIGGVSYIFEGHFPGIVVQAASLTFGTLFVMLCLYQFGVIRVTEKFRLGLLAATGAIGIVYFGSFILGLFGLAPSFITSGGVFGIFFSLVVTGVAALNLVMDFDFIERGAGRAPQHMEWYGAFALMVTLIWLYMECLRLLSKLRESR